MSDVRNFDSEDLALFPDEFMAEWDAKPTKRYRMLSNMPDLDSKVIYDDPAYAGLSLTEKWFMWMDASRDFTLRTVDSSVFDFIESGLPSAASFVREGYARDWWASVDMLDQLKTDKDRKVVNAVAENRFISEDTARYLVLTHKTPAIRIAIARKSSSFVILQLIFNSTKSEAIRSAVLENPVWVKGKV